MQKSKMAVWGGLTNSCEKTRGENQRRKGKIKSNYRVREKNSFLKNKALEVGLETNMEKLMEII